MAPAARPGPRARSPEGPRWVTSSFGRPADTSPGELTSLGEHVARCRGAHGHWVALRCGAERLAGFVDTRRVSAAAIVGVLTWLALRWA
jgi:hypothetical protein